jgi:hypothetical protein
VYAQHAARSGGYQPFLLQMPERLADRAAAHSQPTGNLLLTEGIPWTVLARGDRTTKRFKRPLAQGAAV